MIERRDGWEKTKYNEGRAPRLGVHKGDKHSPKNGNVKSSARGAHQRNQPKSQLLYNYNYDHYHDNNYNTIIL